MYFNVTTLLKNISSNKYIWILGLFVLARGLLILCLLPPLEGWDEYQHIAYIQYLLEKKEIPVLGEATVSETLLHQISKLPQPHFMVKQTASTGALDYKDFFNNSSSPSYHENHAKISLYQAQHGALYYLLMKPIFSFVGGNNNLILSISILRMINVTFILIALIACFSFIYHVTTKKSHALLMMLLVACHPLYLLNSCRVANDPLAILFATLIIIYGLQSRFHGNVLFAFGVGVCLGLGIWVKSTNLSLIPFVVCCLGLSVYNKEISFKKGILVCLLIGITGIIVCYPHIQFTLRTYQTISPMQEALINRHQGIKFVQVVSAIKEINLFIQMYRFWGWQNVWVGGWSFLNANSFILRGIFVLLGLSFTGWGGRFIQRTPPSNLFTQSNTFSLRILLLIGWVSAGLTWHMLHSHTAWGVVTTNSWYACMAFPFMLIMAYEGAFHWKDSVSIFCGWGISVLYIFTEFFGIVFKMLPQYSGGARGLNAIQRIALFHPGWLGVNTIFLLLIGIALLGSMLSLLWLKQRIAEKE